MLFDTDRERDRLERVLGGSTTDCSLDSILSGGDKMKACPKEVLLGVWHGHATRLGRDPICLASTRIAFILSLYTKTRTLLLSPLNRPLIQRSFCLTFFFSIALEENSSTGTSHPHPDVLQLTCCVQR